MQKKEKYYIERELEGKIRRYLKRKEIVAIIGTRQCGKTTLMKHIFMDLKNAKFINFDDREVLSLFNDDIKTFIKIYIENTDFLFIDEFQYAKKGGKQLKFIYDNYDTKIIISGSSAPELSVHSLKYLVGRIFIFTLSPLSFQEFLRFKNKALSNIEKDRQIPEVTFNMLEQLFNEYIIYGGYPEVVLSDNNEEKKDIIHNIYNTYLLREIREILQISDEEKIAKLIKALSLQVGGLVNYSKLSLITGLKYKELIKYLTVLKKTFVLIESKPYFRNRRKELVKIPKIYFLDSGFRNIAINNFQEAENRVDIGALNENFVASELFKKQIDFNFWRTKAGAEVDFVVEVNNKLIPIEVKTILNSSVYGKSFKNFTEEYNVRKGFILSKNYYSNFLIGKCKVKFRPLFFISKEFAG